MAVYVNNLIVNGGTDFAQTFTVEDSSTNAAKNLSAHSAKSQMRKHAAAVGVTTFTTSITNAAGGQIRIGLSTSQTSELKPGRYVYDVILTAPDSSMTRIVEGMVLVREGITK
jgi:hypothetical protein|tara:strand:+ start:211 stop:549 length:339 start_codon:yes stop_codon:yes gene_type:complete